MAEDNLLTEEQEKAVADEEREVEEAAAPAIEKMKKQVDPGE